jgi:SAM-dependent methyltransferase
MSTQPVFDKINIGGGPKFQADGWLNLEEVASPANPNPFVLTPICNFPVPERSVSLIYSSHCFEHLSPLTAERVIAESRRVIRSDGNIVILIPDFDRLLHAWRFKEPYFLYDIDWGFGSIISTWKHRGTEDCLERRAAMMFCGFWNSFHGNLFAGCCNAENPNAYFGPPVLSLEVLNQIAQRYSPSKISAILVDLVMSHEQDYHFCHRNAYSREELDRMFQQHRFGVKTFDRDLIMERFGWIPELPSAAGHIPMSTYVWATPV